MSTLSEAMARNPEGGRPPEDLEIIIAHYRKVREEGLIGARKKAAPKPPAPAGKLNLEELDL